MRGAAAALAGAVLFFLGVLTAASDTDRIPPPPVIPLGDVAVPGATTPAPAVPVPDEAPTPGAPAAGQPQTPVPPPAGDPSAPPAHGSGEPSAPATGEEPPPAGGPRGVETVEGQVDCYQTGDAGRPCPLGQAKKIEDPPEQKGGGDGQR